jgi:TRAP-type uncharacterized transport system fused permease subunit
MGAGAYMMLEIVSPPVTYLEVIRAALVPALLYYLSIFLIVHFYAGGSGCGPPPRRRPAPGRRGPRLARERSSSPPSPRSWLPPRGLHAFRAVTLALGAIVVLGALRPRTRLGLRQAAPTRSSAPRRRRAAVAAAACVGIVVGW